MPLVDGEQTFVTIDNRTWSWMYSLLNKLKCLIFSFIKLTRQSLLSSKDVGIASRAYVVEPDSRFWTEPGPPNHRSWALQRLGSEFRNMSIPGTTQRVEWLKSTYNGNIAKCLIELLRSENRSATESLSDRDFSYEYKQTVNQQLLFVDASKTCVNPNQ